MSQVRTKLEVQTGIAILDRIPVERYRLDDNKAICWLLASMLNQVVNQNGAGPSYAYMMSKIPEHR